MRILLCIAAAVLLCVSAKAKNIQVAAPSTVESARQYYLKGKVYNARGQYGKANEEFKKAQDELKKILSGPASAAPSTGLTKGKKVIYNTAMNIQGKARNAAYTGNSLPTIKTYLKLLRL